MESLPGNIKIPGKCYRFENPFKTTQIHKDSVLTLKSALSSYFPWIYGSKEFLDRITWISSPRHPLPRHLLALANASGRCVRNQLQGFPFRSSSDIWIQGQDDGSADRWSPCLGNKSDQNILQEIFTEGADLFQHGFNKVFLLDEKNHHRYLNLSPPDGESNVQASIIGICLQDGTHIMSFYLHQQPRLIGQDFLRSYQIQLFLVIPN